MLVDVELAEVVLLVFVLIGAASSSIFASILASIGPMPHPYYAQNSEYHIVIPALSFANVIQPTYLLLPFTVIEVVVRNA